MVGSAYSAATASVDWFVLGGGGQPVKASSPSGEIHLNATIGQNVIGLSSSAGEVDLGAGYWYGVPNEYRVYLPVVLR
jgi:hypothetical protein